MGKTLREAYEDAGYKKQGAESTKSAYRLEHRLPVSDKIRAEIARLKREAEEGAILDRQSRQAMLTQIALDSDEKTDNRLRAADMLNRMSGDYTDNIRQTSTGEVKLTYEERKKLLEDSLVE